jgi:uncharacterized protein YhfF
MTLEAIERFWDEFAAATGETGPYTAWAFGGPDNPDLATRLAALVLDGPKRATTSRLADYAEDGEPLPAPGDLGVVLDGTGMPVCIIRTTSVEIRPYGDVDEAFAWDEGEGDRSLAFWRDAHERFFAAAGTPIDALTPLVLERFEKVWPPPADRA